MTFPPEFNNIAMSNDGPPARNMRSSIRGTRRGQPRAIQGVLRPLAVTRQENTPARAESASTPHEEGTIPEKENTNSHEEMAIPREELKAPHEESILTSIDELEQTSSERKSPEDDALSDNETTRDNTREFKKEQEQSFNIASASVGPSVGSTIFSTPFSEVPIDKGK